MEVKYYFLWDTVSIPEQARWGLGSQLQYMIWFIVPAHEASHLITNIITYTLI